MNNGNINNNNKTNNNNVRCVREHKFTFKEIYKAYLSCRKNKRNTINALKFEVNLESNLHELVCALNNKTYNPTRSVCFSIKDPKPREVFASDFKDRIVHHVLYNHLNPIYEKIFIYDSFACRKNKGTLKAVKRLQSFTCKITKNQTKRCFYLQLDVFNFFMSIDKIILFDILCKKTKDKNISHLLKTVIFHNPTKNYVQKGSIYNQQKVPFHKSLFNVDDKKGLAIGNLTSQLFANIYLNELDQYVKHKLKIKYYVRYVDDLVILSDNKKELLFYKSKIISFLNNFLSLKLKEVIFLAPISNGINFVGYIIKPKYLLSRNRNIKNIYKKLDLFKKENIVINCKYTHLKYNNVSNLLNSLNSYFGYLKHSMCKKIIEEVMFRYSFLKFYVYFDKHKVIDVFKNKILDFKTQYFFFKNKFKNTFVFLDVKLFYRVIFEDALFIKNYFTYSLRKTNYYSYVNLFKKEVFILINKLILKDKNIIITKQTNEGNLVFREVISFYILNKNI
jgi:RNA-directed DNA polymerase